jgi:hypothetical protein
MRFVGSSIHPIPRCGDGEGVSVEAPIIFGLLVTVVTIQAEAHVAINEGL